MSERGVFAVDRGIWGHEAFADEPFTEREAWVWMVGEAAFKNRTRNIGGKVVELKRGQLANSIRFMAQAWQWEKDRVARFLKRLKTATMIRTETATGISVITVCNYDEYQRVSLPRATDGETESATATRQQRDKREDTKSIEEEDSEPTALAQAAPVDHRKRLFDEGLKKLATMTGKGPDACRSFVGKCLKAAGDDAVTVLGLIEDAERNKVVDPSAWIAARLKSPTFEGNANGRRTVHAAARDLSAKVRALDEPAPGVRDGTGGSPLRLLPSG